MLIQSAEQIKPYIIHITKTISVMLYYTGCWSISSWLWTHTSLLGFNDQDHDDFCVQKIHTSFQSNSMTANLLLSWKIHTMHEFIYVASLKKDGLWFGPCLWYASFVHRQHHNHDELLTIIELTVLSHEYLFMTLKTHVN